MRVVFVAIVLLSTNTVRGQKSQPNQRVTQALKNRVEEAKCSLARASGLSGTLGALSGCIPQQPPVLSPPPPPTPIIPPSIVPAPLYSPPDAAPPLAPQAVVPSSIAPVPSYPPPNVPAPAPYSPGAPPLPAPVPTLPPVPAPVPMEVPAPAYAPIPVPLVPPAISPGMSPAPAPLVPPAPAPLVPPAPPPAVCVNNPPNGVINTWRYNGNTATYGQTFTVSTSTTTSGFSFPVNFLDGLDSPEAAALGALYRWDSVNNRATGSALASQQISISSTTTQLTVSFSTPVQLDAGGTYVAFFTTSGLWTGGYTLSFSWDTTVPKNPQLGGGFVYFNNGNNPALLTASSWETFFFGRDLAISICFGN